METKNLIVKFLVGIPASGKSTWAKQYLLRNNDWVIVSRDSFRYMLKNTGVTEPKIESMIVELMEETIIKSLNRRLNVIVDNTNLKSKAMNEIIKKVKYKADIEYMVFDVPLKTCIERDNLRDKKVGEDAITAMYKDYKNLIDSYPFQKLSKGFIYEDRFIPLEQDKSLSEAVIFDIDGNISLLGRRDPYDETKVDVDDPNNVVIEHIDFHKSKKRKIILISGRSEYCREKTEYWLNFYNVYYDELLMREKDDIRKDFIIKKEIFNNKIKNKYNIICVYDDRLQVVQKAWYNLGLFCFCTNQGLKDF